MLSKKEGEIILKLARDSINNKHDIPNLEFLKEKKGVFVTLTLNGELRGCIGLPYAVKELGEAVVEAAMSAAYGDPRFFPVSDSEKKTLKIEVSVLSKPVSASLDEIKHGDGVILSYQGEDALFLPQVWEQLPDKTEFLEQLSLKAGLDREAYKKAGYKKFSVQAFNE